MSYIFLSFSEHLNKGANNKNDFYNLSLTEQFELLKRRIPLNRQSSSFMDFINTCFPSGFEKKYYISCPNFLREKYQSSDDSPTYLNNIVLRPELTLSMKSILPDNQNVILIGDIFEGERLKMILIKGIELIDESMSSPYDYPISGHSVCISFEKGIWSINRVDRNDTFLTPNVVADIMESCWTVSKPEIVRKTYDEWKKYIEFRKYYLQEQSKRNFKLDRCVYIDAYAVNRKDYRKNSSIYDDYLLDGRQEFSKGDMIVLYNKVEDAEEFPLIRLDIDRNKKLFDDSKVTKRGKLVNDEERRIRSLASDNVFITALDPSSVSKIKDHNGNRQPITFGEMMEEGYILGDRFKIISHDIAPIDHLNELDKEYENSINKAYENIDAKFDKIIKSEIKKAVESYDKELKKNIDNQIKTKFIELNNSLDKDVIENNDSKILGYISKQRKEIEKNIKKNTKKEKNEKDKDYQERVTNLILKEISKIDIKKMYVDRNNQLIDEFTKSINKERDILLKQYESKKSLEVSNKYKDDIRNEKVRIKEELDNKLKHDKEDVILNETIIRFSLYFRLGDPNNPIKDKERKIIRECNYIVYDNRAEKAKISRQEQALKNFYSGYVKNPYLSTYLFNPKGLDTVRPESSDWIWYLESLNEMQKEAVRKAVSSNGLFLLQGPPGTGKTQVIAETVAHLIKKGKKVLISSETHKAIDNVFERLPKIAEIVPIRLIPSNNAKKENEYDPKYLVDNFYLNISTNMKKSVDRYKNFEKNKIEFAESFDKLKLSKSKIEKSQKTLDEANAEISLLEAKAKDINSEIGQLNDSRDIVKIDIDILRRTKRYIENDNLRPDEDVKSNIIIDYRKKIEPLFSDMSIFADIELGLLLKNISNIKTDEIERELAVINPESNSTLLEIRRKEIKVKMEECKDDFDEVLPEKKSEYEKLRKELISVINQIDAAGDANRDDLKLYSIFNYSYLVNNVSIISNLVRSLKEKTTEEKTIFIDLINSELTSLEEKQDKLELDIASFKQQIMVINDSIIEIQERNDVKEIQEAKFKLENDVNKFFRDFEIAELYKDIDEGLKIIKRKWTELEVDFKSKEKENKEKIPMYEKIVKYIISEDVVEADRKDFTRDLFENANVLGITCTSNDKFSGRTVDALSEYNIDDIDIKTVGIDVVIIDEVSKSSFIDLLIPILYGKTVILVGDHRQLPPMYEFSKLRDDDFEGLDESKINREINKKFTDLYEECFFKTLFEKIPDSYKTMLVQQYRCHEHIMNVFNHFYRGELKLGFAGQNNNKRHNVKLISNGRNIVEPDKHIYFIDCKKTETHEADSTSMYNTGEARVVVELIRKLNDYFRKNSELEKLSIGVICTYGDQARRVKELLKSEKVKTDAFKTDTEKMIVSTVDDFQGDERDIIILSTVRNPEDPRRSNPGFILAYQRINVALSRARRMLVMVGNRKYLEDKGVIDLPDVYGRKGKDQKNFRVYEEILSTIERYGKVVEDIDVLDDKEARING